MFKEKPWLKFYEPHVPEHIDYPDTVMPAVLEQTARKYPDHTALIFKDTKITFRDYNEAVDRFAAALQGLGVKKGDRVAIYMPMVPEAVVAMLACARIGAVHSVVFGGFSAESLRDRILDAEAKVLYNLYSVYTSSYDASASSMVQDILALLEDCNIDQETEAGILFGILVQDIEQGELIPYRERIQQLRQFYEKRGEPIGLGRSLLLLANIEQRLGNYAQMVEYARQAEVYAQDIPLPMRIPFHSNLGFFLVADNPEDGIDHFFLAFDLVGEISVDHQRNLALVIQTYVSIYAEDIDRAKYYQKARQVLETTEDAEIRQMFQEIVDLLTS